MQDILRNIYEEYPNNPYAQKHPRHGYAMGGGVTKTLTWQNNILLRATNPPSTHCVGAVFEYIVDVLKYFGKESEISLAEMRRILDETILNVVDLKIKGYDMSPESLHWWGGTNAMVSRRFATWVDNPRDALAGDFCQLWNFSKEGYYPSRTWGHSMILEGKIAKRVDGGEEHEVIINRGANEKHGLTVDWHYISPPTGHRIFKIARFSKEWLETQKP